MAEASNQPNAIIRFDDPGHVTVEFCRGNQVIGRVRLRPENWRLLLEAMGRGKTGDVLKVNFERN